MNNELEKDMEESGCAIIKLLFWQFPGHDEGNHENLRLASVPA